jgi:hypothetical protein
MKHKIGRLRAYNGTEKRSCFVEKTPKPDDDAVHRVGEEFVVIINALIVDLQGQFEPEHLTLKCAIV